MKSLKYVAVLVLLAGFVYGEAIIIQPTSISYTGTQAEEGSNLDDENNLINGNGLSATPLTVDNIDTVTHATPSFDPPGNAWTTTAPGGPSSDFFASSPGTVVFEMGFDDTYEIASFYNWSYDFNEGYFNANNIRTITLDYGVDDYASTLGTFDLTVPSTHFNATETVLSSTITANQVRITVTDNFSGVSGFGGGDRVSAAEFAFETIPEPFSIGLMACFGGLALLLRRRLKS